MNLYVKMLGFLKPLWKHLILSTLLTLLYVFFNSVSLWTSVDFVRELFSTKTKNSQVTNSENQKTHQKIESSDRYSDLKSKFDLYQKINGAMKKMIIQEDKFKTLQFVCLIIFFSFLLKNIAFYYRKIMISFIELNIIVNIRNRLQESLMFQPVSYFERHHSGQLVSIVFNDVKSMNTVLNNTFGKLLLTPIQVITNIVLMLVFSWQLSLLAFIIVPVSGFFITKIGQSIRRKSRRVLVQISQVTAAFQEAISAIRIVKAFTGEKREIERFQREDYKFFKFNFRSSKLSALTSPFNETLAALMLIGLLWYGGHMVYADMGLDAERFLKFLLFLFASFSPLKDLADIHNTIQTGMAAAERIFDVIEAPREVYETEHSKPFHAFTKEIAYQNINFKYGEEYADVLKNVSLKIKKGETVALVGPSGSGKTTLVNLLPRFYPVISGSILIDGVDIQNFTLTSLREKIGVVTQDAILFNDTVRANIAYGNIHATEQEILEAAKVANALEFINEMDQGFESIIGERGVKLSGGQKQRLSIARAILKNPPILILDEATSALDTESERLVQEAIDKLMKNRTVMVIAHRLSTVINADKIVVMQHGEIIGQGKHADLLKQCALYKMLYKLQFKDEAGENI